MRFLLRRFSTRLRWTTLIGQILCWFACVFVFIGSEARGAEKESADNLPMYGQPDLARSDNAKKADEEFIRNAVAKYGNRQTASNALASEGWTLVRNGKADAALQRFNQAWLLNTKNFQAFWGFGAVLSERGNIAEAIGQLERARELMGDQPQRVALLSDLGTLHSEYAVRMPPEKSLDRAGQFVLANNRFTESLEIDPKFAPSWREWAISLYEQGRYAEAWAKARRAKELNAEPFPPGFLQKLTEKMPEPH
jgi:tetratricopeptide (TPR) repeat protein